MAHAIVGKLNKPANQFQAGDGTGFGIRLGVQYYDRETKQKEWTNYEAVIFANQQAQVDFYQSALVEGSVIEISGESIKIRKFDGQNGQQISLELIGAKLGYVHTGQQQGNYQQQNNNGYGNQQQNQGGYQQQNNQQQYQQQAPQQQQQQNQYQQQSNGYQGQQQNNNNQGGYNSPQQ